MIKKYVCPKCDGTGYMTDRFLTVFTFGIVSAIEWLFNDRPEDQMTKDPCNRCNGKGTIKP